MDIEKILAQTSPERLKLVAILHVNYFQDLLRGDDRNISTVECGYYLGLWRMALQQLTSGAQWQDLPEHIRDEYVDALCSGDYDKEFGGFCNLVDTSRI